MVGHSSSFMGLSTLSSVILGLDLRMTDEGGASVLAYSTVTSDRSPALIVVLASFGARSPSYFTRTT